MKTTKIIHDETIILGVLLGEVELDLWHLICCLLGCI